MAPKTSRGRATKAAAQPSRVATQGKRKAAVEDEPTPRVTRPRLAAKHELGTVAHASHGKVWGCRPGRGSLPPPGHQCHRIPRRGPPNAAICTSQVPGQLFVFGDGDCGQLGLGEDVTERLRPFPLDVDGNKVGWGDSVLTWECLSREGAMSGIHPQCPSCTFAPPRRKQILQVACGGMHTVALTEDHVVYSWGVNDEGALGRETGAAAPLRVQWVGAAGTGCSAALRVSLDAPPPACPPAPTPPPHTPCVAGELWEKSGLSSGVAGDSYSPGPVDLPASAGKVVQLSAGK